VANYEIRHAKYLAERAMQIEESRTAFETFNAEVEAYVTAIADEIDTELKYDSGLETPTAQLAEKVRSLVAGAGQENEQLKDALDAQKSLRDSVMAVHQAMTDSLMTRLTEYETAINDYKEKMAPIEQKTSIVASLREDVGEEQVVLAVDGANLVVGLEGLTFPDEGSSLPTDAFSMLTSASGVLKQFPEKVKIIRVYAPAPGAGEANLELAGKRMTAVKEYLTAQGVEIDDLQFVLSSDPMSLLAAEHMMEGSSNPDDGAEMEDSASEEEDGELSADEESGEESSEGAETSRDHPIEVIVKNVFSLM
jgi:outer membrane protein OmpA-like peptidoglycan-associated protein